MITPTTATAPPSGTPPALPAAATRATSAGGLGKDAFLKLLVAQLRYQDPLNPTDGAQFIAQTAQFTMVERLEEIAQASTDSSKAGALLAASSLVGRVITYTDANGVSAMGTVTGARLGADGPVLLVGEASVPMRAVLDVRAAPPTPPSPPTPPASSTPTTP